MILFVLGPIFIIFLIFLSASFSFAEMALASSSKIRLKIFLKGENKKNKKRANRVLNFIENYNEVIIGIIITNNVINIFAVSFSSFYLSLIFSSSFIGSLVTFVVMTTLIILFGELIPKMYAKKHSETGIMKMSFTLLIVNEFLKPISYFVKLIVKQDDITSPIKNEDELKEVISEAEKIGVTSKDEIKIINAVLSLDETKAFNIMIKKSNVEYVYNNMTNNEYINFAKKTIVTRAPVLNRQGKIEYVFNVKKYLRALYDNPELDHTKYFYNISKFEKDTSVSLILEELKQNRQKLCAIVDKNELFLGILTLEDIVETFVGNIYDEFDIQKDGIYKIKNGQFFVNPDVTIDYLFLKYLSHVKMPSNISKNFTIEQWVIKLGRKKNKKYKLEIGDHFYYQNIIIWIREDSNDREKIIFEIDVI